MLAKRMCLAVFAVLMLFSTFCDVIFVGVM